MSQLEIWAHRSTIIQSVFIVLALAVASLEYFLNLESDRERQREAVTGIIQRSIYPQRIDEAFGELYNPPKEQVLSLSPSDFDDKIASLNSYFHAASICAKAELCDKDLVKNVFCYDFVSYKFAYNKTHPIDRPQNLDGTHWEVFKNCPDEHHFRNLASGGKAIGGMTNVASDVPAQGSNSRRRASHTLPKSHAALMTIRKRNDFRGSQQ